MEHVTMKMTADQLREMGYKETVNGTWVRVNKAGHDRVMVSIKSPAPPKRIRQSTKPEMNKLESEFMAYLKAFYPSWTFHPQALRFKLGNGIWYKPDVVCCNFDGKVACWEVKGPFAHRGGFENLKVAAHKYPEIKWTLVWKENHRWVDQPILP